ncbi:MAG: ABC transporter ATP-binding protein [Burkholderiales bacterium]|nr:ABC transporter ATP-binding protein [Burkholderiales bacterium]
MSEPAIETRALTKRYGRTLAVDGLDLRVAPGEVFGLLGPNGSGKTTTILMLLGLTEVTSGSARVFGLDPARQPLAVKRIVGYLPDSVGFYDDMTARENLRYSGKLAGLTAEALEARISAVLERVRLSDRADSAVRTFSRGMRQRLGLAEVLLKSPRVAILDEPTSGLDPQSTHDFLDMIRGLKADGITVLLSSHLLGQVQAVCDRVGLFYRGRMVLEGTVEALAERVLGGGWRIEVEAEGGDGFDEPLARIAGVQRIERRGAGGFTVSAARDVRAEIAAAAAACGAKLLGLAMQRPSLDEVYTAYFREMAHAA